MGNLFQCFTMLTVKNLFLISSLNLPSSSLKLFPLDLLQQLGGLIVLVVLELDTVLQVGSHESRIEGQNHLPLPGGYTALDATQDMVGHLGCRSTLLAHVESFISQHPQILLLRAALKALNAILPLIFVSGNGLLFLRSLIVCAYCLHMH